MDKKDKTKIVIVGFGYRARYFYRIAKHIPEEFEIVSIVVRDEKKVEEIYEETGIFTTVNLDDALKITHDYVVLSVSKNAIPNMLEVLFEKGEKVLCETPPATSIEGLENVYHLYKKYDAKIQIAEQYFYWGLYQSLYKIVEMGLIGEPLNIKTSALHGYHGVSLIRKFFNLGFKNVSITGKSFEFDVVRTSTRAGLFNDGEIKKIKRDILNLEFENGKNVFWDFTPEFYFSQFMKSHFEVTGVKGQIDDITVRYLNDDFIPVCETINRFDRGVYANREWTHQAMTLGDKLLYKNPFENARLNDDEIAIATCMRNMKIYVDTGIPFYSLEEGLQDGYIDVLMEDALKNPYKTITSETMIWSK